MIVVDTNIIAYLHIAGESTPLALQVLEKDSHWVAPPLWQSEYRNVLTSYIKHKVIDLEEAIRLLENGLNTMQNRELAPTNALVLTLASQSASSSYDCEFVALAREIGCKLVTADKQIVRNFPDTAILLEEFIK
ncbi:MAG: type II toxin-antitoxin system VapC family toxin [Anaerolineales bacterium]|nr:MAG: type II toxin-antitoxin system VapC family toxin [Anaerolineales bacterium]